MSLSKTLAIKVGTLSHNRAFTARDLSDYTGIDGSAAVQRMLRAGLIRRVRRGVYYPTPKGWEWIEAAYKEDSGSARRNSRGRLTRRGR